MAINTVTVKNNVDIYVNDIFVYTFKSAGQAESMRLGLEGVFANPDMDLDFITPSALHGNGNYTVICTLVSRNQGKKTYFYNDAYPAVNRKLYEQANYQLGIFSTSNHASPWYEALKVANAIRYATKLNYNCLRDTSPNVLAKLAVPTNTSNTVNKVISSSCSVQFYGHPDQGTQQGTKSYSSSLGYYVENIYGPVCANGDVLHPMDMTAAITKSNDWSTTYKNKYVKVTNEKNDRYIVVRITDEAPAGKGIELTWLGNILLDYPSTVKLELMD